MIRNIFSAALVASTVLSAAPALADFLASNGLSADATGEGTFEVQFSAALPQAAYWCAAGEYVQGALRAPHQTRIYRASPVKNAPGQPIAFSLNAADSVGSSGILGFKDDGSMSIAGAIQMCDVARLLR